MPVNFFRTHESGQSVTARVTTIIVEGDRNLRLDRASDVIGDVGGNVRTELPREIEKHLRVVQRKLAHFPK